MSKPYAASAVTRSSASGGIAEAVFTSGRTAQRRGTYLGLAIAFALHALALLWGQRHGTRVAAVQTPQHEIDLELEPASPAPPPLETRADQPAQHATTHSPLTAAARPAATRARSAPARAAAIMARAADPNAPEDLSGDIFVTGSASAYVGGVSAAGGTSTRAGTSAVGALAAPRPATRASPDLGKPVELDSDEWRCPWPHAADQEQIDDESVTLRALVEADGRPRSISVLEDPGHGFGDAARACALRTRFTPARDRDGHATRALSPPIRVRFTR
jgi:protein TonB